MTSGERMVWAAAFVREIDNGPVIAAKRARAAVADLRLLGLHRPMLSGDPESSEMAIDMLSTGGDR